MEKPPAYRELHELYHLPENLKPQKTGIFTDRTPFFRGSVDMMFSLSATTYATGVVRIKNGRQR